MVISNKQSNFTAPMWESIRPGLRTSAKGLTCAWQPSTRLTCAWQPSTRCQFRLDTSQRWRQIECRRHTLYAVLKFSCRRRHYSFSLSMIFYSSVVLGKLCGHVQGYLGVLAKLSGSSRCVSCAFQWGKGSVASRDWFSVQTPVSDFHREKIFRIVILILRSSITALR